MWRMPLLRSTVLTLVAVLPLGGLGPAQAMSRAAPPPTVPARASAPLSATTTLSPRGVDARSVVIEGSPDGTQVAAWTVGPANRAVLQVARRTARGGWSAPVSISGRGAQWPRLALGNKGRACLAWELKRAGGSRPQASCFAPARGWSKPRFLVSKGVTSSSVEVAMRGGAAVFVWDRLGAKDRVQSSRRSPTGQWGRITTLSGVWADASAPVVALDGDGLATVAWGETEPGARRAIVVRRQRAAGGWTTEEILSTSDQDAVVPRIAEVAAGQAMVVWAATGADGIWGAHRPGATRPWGSAERLSPDGVAAGSPAVSANRTDDVFVVAWRAQLGGGPAVQATRRQADGSFTLVHQVSTLDAPAVFAPDVVLDAQQFATVVWQEHDGTQYRIGFGRQSNTDTWSAPSYLDAATPQGAYDPVATVFGPYAVGIAWRRYDAADRLRVQTRWYDPAAA